MGIVNIRWSMALSVGHVHVVSSWSHHYTITTGTNYLTLMNIYSALSLEGFNKASSVSKHDFHLCLNLLVHLFFYPRASDKIGPWVLSSFGGFHEIRWILCI